MTIRRKRITKEKKKNTRRKSIRSRREVEIEEKQNPRRTK